MLKIFYAYFTFLFLYKYIILGILTMLLNILAC